MPYPNYTQIETIEFAFQQLEPEDKLNVEMQAAKLELAIKSKNPSVNFGWLDALELIYKTGNWLKGEGL